MRITKQKLIQLIKEELAQEATLDAPLEEKAQEVVKPQELAREVINLLMAGSPAEDRTLETIVNAMAAAADQGEITASSEVKRGLQMLLSGLQKMKKERPSGDDATKK